MTSDEILFAGGKGGTGLTSPYAWYYLNSANGSIIGSTYWWLLSPGNWNGSVASVIFVYGSYIPGFLNDNHVTASRTVRPAISLKSCTLYNTGDGSATNPYTIKETETGC